MGSRTQIFKLQVQTPSIITLMKRIEYDFGYIENKIPIYPIFCLLKADSIPMDFSTGYLKLSASGSLLGP